MFTLCLLLFLKCKEARSMKLLVIYLALGCPARIRFEYDFVHLSTTNGKTIIKTALQGNEITDGISNGLRRLLHLNASDYLNFKDWTVSTTFRVEVCQDRACTLCIISRTNCQLIREEIRHH
ncbi:unnamed protein product [Schistocephalus solidus]|uniref:Gnk2-homologous domain-containing protein n=1 Tax=Schistocephalus solidus TaxID=70667 RepID=A0A183TU55_SCHSO|nr:unnamed protein product [Schistocephalus solidus]